MTDLDALDLADQATWSSTCEGFVDDVCAQLDQSSPKWLEISYNDLGYELRDIELQFSIEQELRTSVLDGVGLLVSHFTRLLPDQIHEIERLGMSPLSSDRHGCTPDQRCKSSGSG